MEDRDEQRCRHARRLGFIRSLLGVMGGTLWMFRGNGDGTFVQAAASLIDNSHDWSADGPIVGIGDFGADGYPDVLVRTTGGNIYRYDGPPGAGGSYKLLKSSAAINSGFSTFTDYAAVGNFSGSNPPAPHMFAVDSSSHTLYNFTGNNNGAFVSGGTALSSGSVWSQVDVILGIW